MGDYPPTNYLPSMLFIKGKPLELERRLNFGSFPSLLWTRCWAQQVQPLLAHFQELRTLQLLLSWLSQLAGLGHAGLLAPCCTVLLIALHTRMLRRNIAGMSSGHLRVPNTNPGELHLGPKSQEQARVWRRLQG